MKSNVMRVRGEPLVIGFTGTKQGMTDAQAHHLRAELIKLRDWPTGVEFHHGDCVGADEQAARIAKDLGYTIVCHPPTNPKLRAFFPNNDIIMPEAPYIDRNYNIVLACDVLMATPHQADEIQRSGTWATVRAAKREGRTVRVFLPNGELGI